MTIKRRKYLRWKDCTRCSVEWHEYWDGENSHGRVGYSHDHKSYGYAVFGEWGWHYGYPTSKEAKQACAKRVKERQSA